MAKRTRDSSLILGAQLRSGDKDALQTVLSAYEDTSGNERAAALLLEVPRRTLINWRSQVPKLAEGVQAIREATASH